jgi:hypothetical protein
VTSRPLRRRDSPGRAVSGPGRIRPGGFGQQQTSALMGHRTLCHGRITGESLEHHDPVFSSDVARRRSRERPADRRSSTNPAILSSESLWDTQLVTWERASPHRRRIKLCIRYGRFCLIRSGGSCFEPGFDRLHDMTPSVSRGEAF